ncbi:hypothetical protein [Streptomyces sp. A0958]|nr:hypothetical protein [Streptomyces sp. A0958]
MQGDGIRSGPVEQCGVDAIAGEPASALGLFSDAVIPARRWARL